MEYKQWYMEYRIHKNRPGLLGDVASLLGMLEVNILTINGVENRTRGMLLQTNDDEKIEVLGRMLQKVDNITVTKLREPKLVDILAVRHGRYIERDSDDRKTFRFTRDELGLLVDFLGEVFKRDGNQVIGLRGMPRVGKTESIIAGSVCSNKRWTFVSSTLLRQTVRSQLSEEEMNPNNIFIIDGIVSTVRSNEKHHTLLQEIMAMPSTKVIEHPDIFIQESAYDLSTFDYIIELRNTPEEEINFDFTANYNEL
ncbi:DUF3388 domain-containing protein [Paenibacillus mendelii]|uniref:DUF3388 domain-containing protein n=1 Tax=Paenibacillus mendelii TaxID=206163 RepID=A0ABV6JKB0_9BACL|nr:DUF3388 domain-containing protein [Paenibacillus mendelii]MCQ6557850.1 DUF3388 domain-containing protein [Paenibacillus mendelii]